MQTSCYPKRRNRYPVPIPKYAQYMWYKMKVALLNP